MTETTQRAEPQTQTLSPGQRYQFRGVFTIEHDEREPVEITWQRVVDDPYERELATAERAAELEAEIERLRTAGRTLLIDTERDEQGRVVVDDDALAAFETALR